MLSSYPLARRALFIDVDGTLVPLQERPEQVRFDSQLVQLLKQLHQQTQGAVALVSGRAHHDLKRLCGALRLTIASSHGAWLENAQQQELYRATVDESQHQQLYSALCQLTQVYEPVWVEQKTHGHAVHYRQAPQCEEALYQAMQTLRQHYPGYVLQPGKMVFEFKLSGVDKGQALQRLSQHQPFSQRYPVMVGDDLTDESAFNWVNQHGGLSIKIGEPGPNSCAQYFLATPQQLHSLLRSWLMP